MNIPQNSNKEVSVMHINRPENRKAPITYSLARTRRELTSPLPGRFRTYSTLYCVQLPSSTMISESHTIPLIFRPASPPIPPKQIPIDPRWSLKRKYAVLEENYQALREAYDRERKRRVIAETHCRFLHQEAEFLKNKINAQEKKGTRRILRSKESLRTGPKAMAAWQEKQEEKAAAAGSLQARRAELARQGENVRFTGALGSKKRHTGSVTKF